MMSLLHQCEKNLLWAALLNTKGIFAFLSLPESDSPLQ